MNKSARGVSSTIQSRFEAYRICSTYVVESIAGDLRMTLETSSRIYTGALVNTILQIHSLEGLNGGEGHTITLPYYWLVATNRLK